MLLHMWRCGDDLTKWWRSFTFLFFFKLCKCCYQNVFPFRDSHNPGFSLSLSLFSTYFILVDWSSLASFHFCVIWYRLLTLWTWLICRDPAIGSERRTPFFLWMIDDYRYFCCKIVITPATLHFFSCCTRNTYRHVFTEAIVIIYMTSFLYPLEHWLQSQIYGRGVYWSLLLSVTLFAYISQQLSRLQVCLLWHRNLNWFTVTGVDDLFFLFPFI